MNQFKGEIFERPGAEDSSETMPEVIMSGSSNEGPQDVRSLVKEIDTEAAFDEKVAKIQGDFPVSPELAKKLQIFQEKKSGLIKNIKAMSSHLTELNGYQPPEVDLAEKPFHPHETITEDSLNALRNEQMQKPYRTYSHEDPNVDPSVKQLVEKARRDGISDNYEKELKPYFHHFGKNAEGDEYLLYVTENEGGEWKFNPADNIGPNGGRSEWNKALIAEFSESKTIHTIHNHSDYGNAEVLKMIQDDYGEDIQLKGEKFGPIAPSIADLESHVAMHRLIGEDMKYADKVVTSEGIWTVEIDKNASWYPTIKSWQRRDDELRKAVMVYYINGTSPEHLNEAQRGQWDDALKEYDEIESRIDSVDSMESYRLAKMNHFIDPDAEGGLAKVIATAKEGGINLSFSSY